MARRTKMSLSQRHAAEAGVGYDPRCAPPHQSREDMQKRVELLERLLGYAVTSERTGFTKPDWWLAEAQKALGYVTGEPQESAK